MNMNKLIIKKTGYDFQKENIDYLSSLSGRERLKVFYILSNYSLLENTRMDLLEKTKGIHTENILTFDDLVNKYSKTNKAFINRNEGSWIIKKIVEILDNFDFSTSLGTSKEILSYILLLKSNEIDSKTFLDNIEDFSELKIVGEIYKQYEEFLFKNNLEDEIGRYNLASKKIYSSLDFEGIEIIINGFIEFRPHELKLIKILTEKGAKIIVQYPFGIRRENEKINKVKSDLEPLGFKIVEDNLTDGDLAYDLLSSSKEKKDVTITEISASNKYYEIREIFITIKKNLAKMQLDKISIVADEEYEELIKRVAFETNIPISIMNEEKGKELPLVGSIINFLEFVLKDEKKKLISYLHDDNLNVDFHGNKNDFIGSLREMRYKGLFHEYDVDEELKNFLVSIRNTIEKIKNNPATELVDFIDEKKLKQNILESYGIHKNINILRNSLNSLELIMDSIKEVTNFSTVLKLKAEEFLEILIDTLTDSKYYSKDERIGVQVLRPINSIGTRSKLRFICGLNSDFPGTNSQGYFFSRKFKSLYENLGIDIEDTQEIYDNNILIFSQTLAGSDDVVLSYTYSDSTLEDDKSIFLKDIQKRIRNGFYAVKCKSMTKSNADLYDSIRDRALSDINNKLDDEIHLDYFSKEEINRLQNILSNFHKRNKGENKFWGLVDEEFIFNEYYATKLDTFNTCPFKFYLKYILDYESFVLDYVDEYHKDRGNLYHNILNILYKEMDVFNTETEVLSKKISELVEIHTSEGDADLEIEIQKKIYKKILLDFVTADKTEHEKIKSDFKPKYFEREFSKNFVDFNVRGKIDRIDEDSEGNLIVIDYKSKSTPTGNQVRNLYDLQLPIYSYILDTDRVKAAYYASIQEASLTKGFYQKDFAPDRTKNKFTEEELQNFYEEVKVLIFNIHSDIRNGKFLVRPKTKDSCKNCEYKDICRIEELTSNGI